MDEVKLHYDVSAYDFTRAGEASGKLKRSLKTLGFSPAVTRNVAIAVYEAEINMVIHAGPGIPNVELAMKEGYSTAPENVRSLGFGAGMGLPNIKKYTDEMKIDTVIGEGTTITLKVYNK